MSDTKDFDLQHEDFENKISLLVKTIKDTLIARGEMMATAESLTGGLVASSIVNEAGSSAILAGGIVAYQNEIKESLLDVPHQVLETEGAVSAETVKAMAEGARKKFGCEWAIATSGIAGPTGAEPGKPVGTVWMAVTCEGVVWAEKKHFRGSREQITTQATIAALVMLYKKITSYKV